MLIGTLLLMNTDSEAQYYYTSYGYAQEWHLPQYVHHSIYDHYYGFEIAHVRKYKKHGHRHYNILLHRNGWFVELKLDHHGHIYKTIKHRQYNPLITHHCNNHCGYHKTYYHAYYPNYHRHHHGYSTTVYVNSSHGNHKHKKHYTNVYIEQPNKHYKNNKTQQVHRSSEPKVIRHANRTEHSRPSAGSRITRGEDRNQVSLNTSRGRSRGDGSNRYERSTRNK